MRVALLSFYPLDTRVVPGGIRMVAYNLVEGFRGLDLELHVLHCHADVPEDRLVQEDHVAIHYLALPRRRVVPNLIASVARLVRHLRVLQPDLVHAHAAHFAYAGVRAGYPTVYTIHGVLSREREIYSQTLYDRLRYGLLAFFEARALHRVDQLVAISDYVQKAYTSQTKGLPWVRIDNPVEEALFTLDDCAEPGRVLYAGSITEIKDLFTLVRAILLLHKEGRRVTLRLAGRATSPAYAARLRAYVQEQGLQEIVQFLGLLGREELHREYACASVVALSSLQENAPMAIIEAMAAGKPVVATRVGGVPELVQEAETGFLVKVGDVQALAERLARLLADPALRRRMGQRAREVAWKRFSRERIARAYYALYQRVLQST
ncbi:MAG: glycosyltransferase family 4 protein [Anaerolineae bacterium]|nr:glycosyltransferase family 4 protein [Anaerolineae bacterium]